MHAVPIGKHSPRLSEVRKALRQGALTSDGLLPVEGPRMIGEAARSGLEIVELFLLAGFDQEAAGRDWPGVSARTHIVPAALFRSIAGTREPQGVLALVRPPRFVLDDVFHPAASPPVLIVLCRLQDPGNAGTILRLAEAFGAGGCVATTGTAGRYNPKLVRATAGSLFRLPHVWDLDLGSLAARAREAGLRVVGAAGDGGVDIGGWDWNQGTALLVGNEGEGLAPAERAECDAVVRIPHSTRVDSLNAASAAAVCLYEAYRQRRLATD